MPVPHFLRCPWCGNYLSENQYAEALRGNRCCQICTGSLSDAPHTPHDSTDEQNIWLRCPICLQVVRVDQMQNQSALSIHQSHLSSERRKRIAQLIAEPTALKKHLKDSHKDPHKEMLWTEVLAKRAVKLGILSTLPLESCYPNPTDCTQLFWYHHRLR